MSSNENQAGYWVRSEKKFYYLESGNVLVRNELERLQKVLLSRGHKFFSDTPLQVGSEPVKRMSKNEALEKGYEVVPVYLNDFVKSQFENVE